MGWHLDLAVARVGGAAVPDWSSVREDPEQARALVAALWPHRPLPLEEPAALEDALGWAADGVYVGAYGGTVLLSHASFAPRREDVLAALSRQVAGTVVSGFVEDAVVAYGLQAYRDGQLVRDYQWFDGAVRVDTGPMLPGEVDGDDEERVFGALGAVLGLRLDQGPEQGPGPVEPLELPVRRFTPAPLPRPVRPPVPAASPVQRLRGWLAGHPSGAALLVLLLVALLVQAAIRL